MRKNTQTIFAAFINGKASGKRGTAVWTDGVTVYSYGTALLTYLPPEGRFSGQFVLNRTRYSVTTTNQQNGLAALLAAHFGPGYDWLARVFESHGQPVGATPDELRDAPRRLRPVA